MRIYGYEKIIFFMWLLLFPIVTYAQEDVDLKDKVIESTLHAMEIKKRPSWVPKQISIKKEKNHFKQEIQKNIQWSMHDINFILALAFGYIKGNTAYDFNHHTSELEFPMDNAMVGGKFSLSYKDLSLHTELWTRVDKYAGFKMKDKDWDSAGILISSTKSKAYMDAIISDTYLRYDFLKKLDLEANELKFDEIKIGALLGYKFERFDFDMYDIWQQLDNTTTNRGKKVLTYKIKYYLPYLGLAADFSRENAGFGMNIKYSFHPTAYDKDNHLLRGLTFYADYTKNGQALMGSIYGFWEFIQNWKLKAGADGTFIRIDGRTWEAFYDPVWDADQSTDTRYWIFWSGVEHRF